MATSVTVPEENLIDALEPCKIPRQQLIVKPEEEITKFLCKLDTKHNLATIRNDTLHNAPFF